MLPILLQNICVVKKRNNAEGKRVDMLHLRED